MRRYIFPLFYTHIFLHLSNGNNFYFSILISPILGLKRNRVYYPIYRTVYLFVTL